jgi:hypothetical protein
MVPAGYMAKRVVARPDWLPADSVSSIYSVSGCVSHDFNDVVTFYVQTSPECAPLSCNSLAAEVETNTRCLLQSFEHARALLENGTFNASEPGPYRIVAVYSVAWPSGA